MFTNLFASDENVFLQFPVSHPFSYLTNWMQFSTRSLHKRFVRAAQKKPTNDSSCWWHWNWKKRLKTVENESIANNGFRTKNPNQKFFFCHLFVERIQVGRWLLRASGTKPHWLGYSPEIVFILIWYLFLLVVFSELILVCCWQINIKCYRRMLGLWMENAR